MIRHKNNKSFWIVIVALILVYNFGLWQISSLCVKGILKDNRALSLAVSVGFDSEVNMLPYETYPKSLILRKQHLISP